MSHSASLAARLADHSARIGVVGLGYVGLPLAVTAVKRGFSVTGFDIDAGKMDRLDSGRSYIEAVSDSDLAECVAAGRLDWTTDFSRLGACDALIICVPTPLNRNREPDLSFVTDTAETIARHLRPGQLVVLESTTFPGTTREVLTPILARSGLVAGQDFFVGFSPEREDPGNERFRTATIPKIVAGDGPEAAELVQLLYRGIVDKVVPVSTTATAEAVKITENIFRAVNIALVNELKLVFDAMGIDVWEVIDGAATKPFGFMPFYPGPGLGGHCIPIDPFYLTWKAREYEQSARFIELAGEINTRMPYHVVERVRLAMDRFRGRGLTGARILVVGIAYKKNVGDMRESPAMKIMELLHAAGADTAFHDPLVPAIPRMREYPQFEGQTSVPAEAISADAFDLAIITTDHDVIDYAALAASGLPIVDTRNAIANRNLSPAQVMKA
jgi:UDP-N-acetyl-D-glucosamine dehydrogenase